MYMYKYKYMVLHLLPNFQWPLYHSIGKRPLEHAGDVFCSSDVSLLYITHRRWLPADSSVSCLHVRLLVTQTCRNFHLCSTFLLKCNLLFFPTFCYPLLLSVKPSPHLRVASLLSLSLPPTFNTSPCPLILLSSFSPTSFFYHNHTATSPSIFCCCPRPFKTSQLSLFLFFSISPFLSLNTYSFFHSSFTDLSPHLSSHSLFSGCLIPLNLLSLARLSSSFSPILSHSSANLSLPISALSFCHLPLSFIRLSLAITPPSPVFL